jgi:methylphosphotriester-DNA--protein-cysteine methyltransferase
MLSGERCRIRLFAARSAPEFATRVLLTTRGRVRIDLLKKPGLSARHFQRRFTTQIGLPPKLYARTIRFDAALMAHPKTRRGPGGKSFTKPAILIRRTSFATAMHW